MGENFFINIDCSRVLIDSNETQYTMFIDGTKISIVYELVEWIRWMFSIENCFYLSHGNSVIHELEDIQLLSKLKNFEIKLCGQSHCIHKTMYRTLLSNFNLFVSWNEIKVHKYFVDKITQMDQKLTNENNRPLIGVAVSSNTEAHQDLMDFKDAKSEKGKDGAVNNFFSDSKFSNPVENSSFIKKDAFTDNFESKPKAKEKLKLKMMSYFHEKPIKSPLKNESETEQVSNVNCTKSGSRRSSNKHIKPFSVGKILSDIRKDFEKQYTEVKVKKNSLPVNFSFSEEGNFDDKMVVDDLLINENNTTEVKKRQRTRRRKKSKKQSLENETIISPFLESSSAISDLNYLKSNSTLKPNHIRFDIDDEDNVINSSCVEGNMNTQNEKEFEIIHKKFENINSSTAFNVESEKSAKIINDDCQDLSDSQLLNSSIINTENKMDYSSEVNDLIQIEEKQNDFGDQICNNINLSCSEAENFHPVNCNTDLNALLSLKEKCKNLVIKRFY